MPLRAEVFDDASEGFVALDMQRDANPAANSSELEEDSDSDSATMPHGRRQAADFLMMIKGASLLHSNIAVRPPKLILMAGDEATGKTTLTHLLAEAANHPQLQRDSTLRCALAANVPHLVEIPVAEEAVKEAGRTYLKSIAAGFRSLPANSPASLFIFFDECQAGRLQYFNKLRSFLTNGFISLPQLANKAHREQRQVFAPPPLCDVTLVFVIRSEGKRAASRPRWSRRGHPPRKMCARPWRYPCVRHSWERASATTPHGSRG